MKTFEEYLKEAHAKDYSGTDDNMPDDFEHWLSILGVDEWIGYAELWHVSLVSQGKK